MTSAIRVAVVARSVFPVHGMGGLERHVFDLVQYLARAGAEVTLITRTAKPASSDAGSALDPRITLVTVPYRTFPLAGRRGTTVIDRSTAYPLFGMRAGRAAWELVRDGKIDIVHGLGASVLGYARKRATSTAPLVLNPQGLEEFGATHPERAPLKRAGYLPLRRAVLACAAAADCIIATDRSLEPVVRAHLRVPAERVRVIPNALDLRSLDALATGADGAAVRRAAGIAPDDVVIVSVGRIEENKGFHVLAAALGALAADGARLPEGRWRWVMIGDGPYRSRLEKTIAEHKLERATIVLGRLDDRALHAWYEAATLFVHPTLYEGSSLVTLEAMAHRRAVIATRAGGLPDKVRPGVNGWLVEPGDPSALAAAISGALARPDALAALGRAGRGIVEREFSWDAAGAATLNLYRELLRERATVTGP
ncbi:MAG TPA: glycosyltransferase family 4 protein [Vicinamibacterales bacterium]|nr:glycosyltransferase family 4 protein [Vicinamibacterales bacterium]